MEVILLEKIRKLGALGEKVRVRSGYARNYLIPQGKAVYATSENLLAFEKRRIELEKLAAEKHEKALLRQKSLQDLPVINIKVKASEEGKLFGSVGTREIVEAVSEVGVTIEKREIQLPEGALRTVGEYELLIDLENDIVATIKVSITPEA
ncbi:MAG: 50S ribosomal protein L9 [Gammaproteobacteria bacterium RIFCSPHIGHO2_12_FULL_38_14]|nr:MAG: 50S ribosomal protein L9 [Gammaproteobacteria bacterium RIFCSPHIGHO2_12_FULL_38_14]